MPDNKTQPPPAKPVVAKNTARIDATHMGSASLRDDVKPKATVPPPAAQEDEDWGVDANDNVDITDDSEEREIEAVDRTPSPRGGEANQPQTRSKTVTEAPEAPVANTNMSADDYFQMLERLESFKANAITSLQEELTLEQQTLDEATAAFNAKKTEIEGKLRKLGVEVGAVAVENDEAPGVKQRGGRRRRRVSSDDDGTPTPAAKTNPSTPTAPGEPTGSPRRRQKNDKTLKEAIVEVLTNRGRADLKTIANDIVTGGFKTNSKKFGNTVRVQLYRLDDDGEVVQYEDNTFGMKKK